MSTNIQANVLAVAEYASMQATNPNNVQVTRVKTAGKHNLQRDGETLHQCEERQRQRRIMNAAKMRERREGIKAQVMHEGLTVMLEHQLPQSDAVQVVMPERYQGRVVAKTTQGDIIDGLTTRFSRGFSSAKYKIRRPNYSDCSKYVFDKLARENAVYNLPDFVSSRSDVFRNVQVERNFPHVAVLQNNHDVISTMSESLASSGLQSDGMPKSTGMMKGSVKLSNLFTRHHVGYFARNEQGELEQRSVAVLVSSETGNSYIAPIEADDSEDIDSTPQTFNESCSDPSEFGRLLQADVTAPQHQTKRDKIAATIAANTVRAEVTLFAQFALGRADGVFSIFPRPSATR